MRRQRHRKLGPAGAAVSALACLWPVLLHAQGRPLAGQAVLELQAPESVDAGEEFEVLILADLSGVTGAGPGDTRVAAALGSLFLSVSFDSRRLGFLSAGTAPSSPWTDPPTFTDADLANAAGRIRLASVQSCSQAEPCQSPPPGAFPLLLLRFRGRSSGEARVEFASGGGGASLSLATRYLDAPGTGPASLPVRGLGTSVSVVSTLPDRGLLGAVLLACGLVAFGISRQLRRRSP